MTDLQPAVVEYLRREKEANANMRGADHQLIMHQVSQEYGIDYAVLAEAVLDASFAGAN